MMKNGFSEADWCFTRYSGNEVGLVARWHDLDKEWDRSWRVKLCDFQWEKDLEMLRSEAKEILNESEEVLSDCGGQGEGHEEWK